MNEAEQLAEALRERANEPIYSVATVPDLIANAPTLASVGQSISKDDATRKLNELITMLRSMAATNETVHAEYDSAHEGIVRLEGARTKLREEQNVQSTADCQRAITTGEWKELASAWKQRDEQMSFINMAVEYGRRVIRPSNQIRILESDYALAALNASMLTWVAVLAAIERFEASRNLLEVDNGVIFSASVGRAAEALQKSHHAHAIATRAYEALTAERTRQEKERELQLKHG